MKLLFAPILIHVLLLQTFFKYVSLEKVTYEIGDPLEKEYGVLKHASIVSNLMLGLH